MKTKVFHLTDNNSIDVYAAHQPGRREGEKPCWLFTPRSGFIVRALIGSFTLIFSCAHATLNAQSISLYDTMDWSRDPDFGVGRWKAWPEATSDWLAQPFLTGDSDNVSSVTIDLARRGQPTGELSVEIWDDNSAGVPGNLVGVVGTLDITSLSEEEWEFITLDNQVTGLAPRSSYYVVLNPSSTNINSGNSYVHAGTSSDAGTGGASPTLAKLPSGWAELKNLLNSNFSFLQAAVTAESTTLPGDFDNDGVLSVADIDMLGAEIVAGTDDSTFDLTGDSVVDHTDLTTWLLEAAERNGFSEAYSLSDSNLDGTVNSDDLNSLALNWQQSGAPWSGGDFTADGVVDSDDLNQLALNWRQSIPMASAVSAPVPEPSAWLLMVVGLTLTFRRRRRG